MTLEEKTIIIEKMYEELSPDYLFCLKARENGLITEKVIKTIAIGETLGFVIETLKKDVIIDKKESE